MIMFFYALLLVIFLVAAFLVRYEPLPPSMEEEKGLNRSFHQMAGFIYRKFLRRKKSAEVTSIKKDLNTITPTTKGEEQVAEYYIKKLGNCFIILLCGIILALLAALSSRQDTKLQIKDKLKRGNYGEVSTNSELEAVTESGEKLGIYKIKVNSKQYTLVQLGELEEELSSKLPNLIKGKNSSLDNVRTDLKLMEKVEGYPFKIYWRTTDFMTVSSSGKVKNEDLEKEGKDVILSAELSCQDFTTTTQMFVHVYPPILSDTQKKYVQVQKLIDEQDEKSSTTDYQTLPKNYGKQKIVWKKPLHDSSVFLFILLFFVSILVYFIEDKKVRGKIKEREEEMIRQYPNLISKIVLYLGAGMTVRGVFDKLSTDYTASLQNGGDRSYLYEEIRMMSHEIGTGVSESKAYEAFGVRCRCHQYTRLVNLLNQNLKKGNSSLLPLLKQEAEKASVERLNIARKAGEKVTTKLLVPMMMILGIIMIIIMVPAFHSF